MSRSFFSFETKERRSAFLCHLKEAVPCAKIIMVDSEFEKVLTEDHEREAEKIRQSLFGSRDPGTISIMAWASLVGQKLKSVFSLEKDDEL